MKTKSGTQRKTSKSTQKAAAKAAVQPSVNGTAPPLSFEVFTLCEAAEFLRVDQDEIRKLVESGKFPGKKIGDDWRILKAAVCEWLSRPEIDSVQSYRDRVMATAGSMAHDDTVDEMLKNIYSERKKHLVGDGLE